MARRASSKNTDPTTKEAVVTDTATEAAPEVAETTADPTPVETTEPTEAPAAKVETSDEPDLSAFQAAVDAAIESKDESTGEVAVKFVEDVNKAYRELDGVKAKNAAKKVLVEGMTVNMKSNDMLAARAYLSLQENLSAATPAAHKERTPADPTGAYVDRQVTLDLARQLIVVPEGVDAAAASEKAQEKYSALYQPAVDYLAWLQNESEDKGDEPEVDSIVKSAAKLAIGKAARPGGKASAASRVSSGEGYSGPRRSVVAHITSAFADQPSGTFLTVNQIRKHRSDEYGDDSPSAGAVSARLNPKSGKSTLPEGLSVATKDGHLGVLKA
jgi:hypothetical protein